MAAELEILGVTMITEDLWAYAARQEAPALAPCRQASVFMAVLPRRWAGQTGSRTRRGLSPQSAGLFRPAGRRPWQHLRRIQQRPGTTA